MGCDIHMFTEKLSGEHNKWSNCDNWRYNEWYNEENPDGESKMEISPIHYGRNYTLFTVLAGVRDYGNGTKCIFEPRGLPENASDIVKQESEKWGSDGHSHSYLTLKEIKDFGLTQNLI